MRFSRLKAVIGFAVVALFSTAQVSATPIQWAGNGHWYDIVDDPNVPWADANDAANASIHLGLTGHLVTIKNAEEDAFTSSLLAGTDAQYYAGGFQDPGVTPADFGWQWVTGETWDYTNWSPGEPNDAYLAPDLEQALGINWLGDAWNDEWNLGNIAGYVVEYEPAGVPDGGSTLALLGLGFLALLGLRRK